MIKALRFCSRAPAHEQRRTLEAAASLLVIQLFFAVLPFRSALRVFALVACAAAPALAGDVLIPLAANQQSTGNLTYSTRIWVSNPSTTSLSFTSRFFPAGTDGTKAAPASTAMVVAPGATVVLTGVAPLGSSGMLSLTGSPQLSTVARVESFIGGQSVGLSDVPSINSTNVYAAGAFAQLPGLQRVNGTAFSDVFVYNLEAKVAQCTLRIYQSNGAQIGAAATATLLPLQRRDFIDTINILGLADLADVRVQVSCDHKFFLAGLVRRTSGELAFVVPAATLATNLLGEGGSEPPPANGDSVTLTVPGLFLNAVAGNSYKSFELAAKKGVNYKTAVVEFDMLIKGFPEGLFTGVHSFRRKGTRTLFYGLQIVNRNSKTTLDLGIDDVLARGDGPWQSFHAYHLKITYDVPGRVVRLEVFEGGVRKQNLSGQAQHLDLTNDGHTLAVDFGMTGIADGAYYPPLGWQYSNLKVVLTP